MDLATFWFIVLGVLWTGPSSSRLRLRRRPAARPRPQGVGEALAMPRMPNADVAEKRQ